MKCEFCNQPNHDQAVAALAELFSAVAWEDEHDDDWFMERAHLAWRDMNRAGTVSIPSDKQTLMLWVEALQP